MTSKKPASLLAVPVEWQQAAKAVESMFPEHASQLRRVMTDQRTAGVWQKIERRMRLHRPVDGWVDAGYPLCGDYQSVRCELLAMIARAREPLPPPIGNAKEVRREMGESLRSVAHRLRSQLGGIDLSLKSVLLSHWGFGRNPHAVFRRPDDADQAKAISSRIVDAPDISFVSLLMTVAGTLERFESLAPLQDRVTWTPDPAVPINRHKNAKQTAFVNSAARLLSFATKGPMTNALQDITNATFNATDETRGVEGIVSRFHRASRRKPTP